MEKTITKTVIKNTKMERTNTKMEKTNTKTEKISIEIGKIKMVKTHTIRLKWITIKDPTKNTKTEIILLLLVRTIFVRKFIISY